MGELVRGALPVETYTLGCRACHASARVPADASSFDCTSCGRRHFIVGCERCGGANVLVANGRGLPNGWTCSWCLAQVANVGFSRLRRRGGATAADAWRSLDDHGFTRGDPQVRVLGGFELLAGSGDCPPHGTLCSIAALADGVLVVAEIGARGQTLLPYRDLLELEVGGRGLVTSGGRFVGGGVGLMGAMSGMAVASMLNRASRKTSLDSFLRITSRHTEMLMGQLRFPPKTVRGGLSRMFTAQLAASRAAATPPPVVISAPTPAPLPSGPVDELERLTKLHAAGTLTDTEFEAARAREIKRLQAGER